MYNLGPMDFFSETDRLAVVQQLRMREAASRNIADLYRAKLEEIESHADNLEHHRLIEELNKGIAAAEAKARETAQGISGWERPS